MGNHKSTLHSEANNIKSKASKRTNGNKKTADSGSNSGVQYVIQISKRFRSNNNNSKFKENNADTTNNLVLKSNSTPSTGISGSSNTKKSINTWSLNNPLMRKQYDNETRRAESEYTNINEYSELNLPNAKNNKYTDEGLYESELDLVDSKKNKFTTDNYITIDDDFKNLQPKEEKIIENNLYAQVNISKQNLNNLGSSVSSCSSTVSSGSSGSKKNAQHHLQKMFGKLKKNKNNLKTVETAKLPIENPPVKSFDPDKELLYATSGSNSEDLYIKINDKTNPSSISFVENSSTDMANDDVLTKRVKKLSCASLENPVIPPNSLPPPLPPIILNSKSINTVDMPEYECINSMTTMPLKTESNSSSANSIMNTNETDQSIYLNINDEQDELWLENQRETVRAPPLPPASTQPSKEQFKLQHTTIEPMSINNQVYYSFTSPQDLSFLNEITNSNNNTTASETHNTVITVSTTSSSTGTSSPLTPSSPDSFKLIDSTERRYINIIDVHDYNIYNRDQKNNTESNKHVFVCQVVNEQSNTQQEEQNIESNKRTVFINSPKPTSININRNTNSELQESLINNAKTYVVKL